jgi:maltose-binding protein MalE
MRPDLVESLNRLWQIASDVLPEGISTSKAEEAALKEAVQQITAILLGNA